jgi:transcription termination factor Rho
MSVLDRDALESSPLADLHAIASELGIDGYRRLRKTELIDALLARSGDRTQEASASDEADEERAVSGDQASEAGEPAEPRGRRRGRRGGRGRGARPQEGAEEAAESDRGEPATAGGEPAMEAGEPATADGEPEIPAMEEEDGRIVVGVVDLVPGGSAFLRVDPPLPSDDDVYISAAQVKRCELVNGDRVSGPRRAARRSERYASLIRVDTINGLPATDVTDGARYDDLPAAFPSVALPFAADNPVVAEIQAMAPFGRGSRVTIVGPARSGKSRLLRALADALAPGAEREGVQVLVALAGIRPEEITEWYEAAFKPLGAASLGASADTHDQTIELVVDQARRIAARGANAVVLLDTLDALHPHAARKALAAARQIVDGGSLTLVATACKPLGGETTVIALDYTRAWAGEFPAVDGPSSGTLRAELLAHAR